MGTNCEFGVVGGWVVVVHNERPPLASEWLSLLDYYKMNLGTTKGILVYTTGGALSAFQRKQLRDVFSDGGENLPRTAILTDSALARLGITAFNIFVSGKVGAFAPHAHASAMNYLEIPQEARAPLLQKLEEVARALGVNLPKSYHAG